SRQNSLAVGAEGHGMDCRRMLERCAEGLAGGHLPELGLSAVVAKVKVAASRQHHLAVGTERRGTDLVLVRQRLPDDLPRGHLPEPGRVVLGCHKDELAIWTEARGPHRAEGLAFHRPFGDETGPQGAYLAIPACQVCTGRPLEIRRIVGP